MRPCASRANRTAQESVTNKKHRSKRNSEDQASSKHNSWTFVRCTHLVDGKHDLLATKVELLHVVAAVCCEKNERDFGEYDVLGGADALDALLELRY
jgi:hypothetical protein